MRIAGRLALQCFAAMESTAARWRCAARRSRRSRQSSWLSRYLV